MNSPLDLIGHGRIAYRPSRAITLPAMAWGTTITLTKGRDYDDVPPAHVCAAAKGGEK